MNFYLQSGQCTFYIQDKTYLMKEGDIAVIPPDILHKTAYLAEVNKRLCIEFSANYIQPVISMFGNETLDSRLFTVLHNSTENTAFLDSLILNMINEYKQRDYISPAFLNVYFRNLYCVSCVEVSHLTDARLILITQAIQCSLPLIILMRIFRAGSHSQILQNVFT